MNKSKIITLILSLAIFAGCQTGGIQNTGIQNKSQPAESTVEQKVTTGTVTIQTQATSGQETLDQAATTATATPLISKITLSDQPPDKCNSPLDLLGTSDPDHHATIMPDGNISFWGDAYISAEVSSGTDKNFEVQWYIGETDSNPQTREDFTTAVPIDRFVTKWTLHSSQNNVTAAKSCNGKFYLNVVTPSLESDFGVMGTWLSPRKAVFLFNDEIIGEKSFYFQQ
jgi:hypothetical protein